MKHGDEKRRENVSTKPTYDFQLQVFARAIIASPRVNPNGFYSDETPTITSPGDAVGNMRVIDEIYRQAGLNPWVSVNSRIFLLPGYIIRFKEAIIFFIVGKACKPFHGGDVSPT